MLRTLERSRHTRCNELPLTAFQRFDQQVEVHIQHFQLHAQLIGHQLRQVDVHTGRACRPRPDIRTVENPWPSSSSGHLFPESPPQRTSRLLSPGPDAPEDADALPAAELAGADAPEPPQAARPNIRTAAIANANIFFITPMLPLLFPFCAPAPSAASMALLYSHIYSLSTNFYAICFFSAHCTAFNPPCTPS